MLTKGTPSAAELSQKNALNTKEASAYTGMSANTLECYRSRGLGPKFVKYARAVRYRVSDLDDFMGTAVRSTSEVVCDG